MAGKFIRPTVYLSGLQKRFELPVFEGANYTDNYLESCTVILSHIWDQ